MASTRDVLIFTVLLAQTAAIGWLVVDRLDHGDAEILERIDALETGVAETAQAARGAELAAERQQRHVAGLERRVLDVERDLPATPAAQAAPGASATDGSVDRKPSAATELARHDEILAAKRKARDMQAQLAAQADAVAQKLGEVGIKLKTIKLRSLPEEERWGAARDTVGLNDTQAREIQEATRDRDIEFERATSHETATDDDGTVRKTVYVDLDIRQAADDAYTVRVNGTLTDEQRGLWRSEGFEGAFGVRRPRPATYVSRSKPR